MKHFLIITNASGETKRREVRDGERIPVEPGDDVVVVDENGEPADVQMKSEGDDLVLEFENGEKVSLADFYQAEGGDPITVGVSPSSNSWAEYEFNSQVGNLPSATKFTLMRLSNTEYIDFEEQTEPLDDWVLLPYNPQSRLGGGDPGDEPPEALPDEEEVEQGGSVSVFLLGNDRDPEGGGLTIVGIDGRGVTPGRTVEIDSGAEVTLKGGGFVDYAPGDGFRYLGDGVSATDTFSYTIEDTNGNQVTSTVTITISGENDPPEPVDDGYEFSEDAPVTVSPLENDDDPDANDTLTLVGVTDPQDGTVVLNPDNTLTYDPAGAFEYLGVGETATTTVVYTVSDDDGATATAQVTFTINGENDDPTANPDVTTTSEDDAVNIPVLDNDTDPDVNDELNVCGIEVGGVMVTPTPGVPVTLDSGGRVVLLVDGTIDYTPPASANALDAGESLVDVFTYKIDDGNGGSATATTTVTVTGEDDPTVTNPDVDVTDEDTAIVVDVLANDSDADTSDNPLSVTNVVQPPVGQGSVINNGADVTFDPGTDFQDLAVGETEIVSFTYDATTPDGDTVTENVTITVEGLNDDPTANPDVSVTSEDDPVNIPVLTNDTDPDTSDELNVCGIEVGGVMITPTPGVPVTLDSGGRVVLLVDGTIDYTPPASANALDAGESLVDVFTYKIDDGNGGTATATTTVTVTGEDDPTVTNPDVDVTDEDTAIVVDVLANDSDADTSDNPLSVTNVVQPPAGQGSVINNGADVTFDPGTDFQDLAVGETEIVNFTYDATTPDGDTTTENVTITVVGTNDDPVANPDGETTPENTPVTLDPLSNDTDPDVSDEIEICGIEVGGAMVTPTPGIPLTLDSGAVITVFSDGTIDYVPPAGTNDLDAGETWIDTFTYKIDDGNGGTATTTASVTVTGEDDPTVTNPDVDVTDEDTAIVVDVLANDSDPDTTDNPLSVTNVVQPPAGQGSVVNNGTDVTFDPGSDFQDLAVGETEIVNFTYDATTPDGDTTTENVTITVVGTNDGPVANPDVETTPETTPVNIPVLDNDTDPDGSDTLNVCGIEVGGAMVTPVVGNPITLDSGATVVLLADGTMDYTPPASANALDAGESLVDVFTYKIDDGNGGTATATTTVTVTGEDDPTVTNPDVDVTDEDTAIVVDVLANDSDPDTTDNPLSVTNVVQPPAGQGSVINNGNNVTFDPGTDFQDLAVGETEIVNFTYDATTPDGDAVTENVTITVTGVNDAPDAIDDGESTTENASVTVDVLGNDIDVDGDTLTVTNINQPPAGQGSATFTANDVTFNPGSDFDDLATGETELVNFTYDISDGQGGTDTANITITVVGTNDPPVAEDDVLVSVDPIDAVTLDIVANDTDVDGNIDPTTVDLDPSTPGEQKSLVVAGEGTWTVDNAGVVTFTPVDPLPGQPTPINYTVKDDDGQVSNEGTITVNYSAANVWFGNDESASVDATEFDQGRSLISGTADLMDFSPGDVGFNAALYTWSDTASQDTELALTSDKAQFVNDSRNYSRDFSGGTDVGQAIVYGAGLIANSVAALQAAGDPRADVPQALVILTDAFREQIVDDTSLLSDAAAAKAAGITLVFVAIQDATDPDAIAVLEQAASTDSAGNPLVVQAQAYADISNQDMFNVVQAIREGAAANLPATPPVVIDMDGDGVEYDSVEDGIALDVDGDGEKEQTAWANEDDAVLVFDANENGAVDGRSEFAFADYSDNPDATDMEGLRAHFDTDDDGLLTANDEQWDRFRLWQDKDGDGEVDEGEMVSLDEAGIESIGLVSDGVSSVEADGDVLVHGESEVTYSDGSTGTAADAEFRFEELLDSGTGELEALTESGDVIDLNGTNEELPGEALAPEDLAGAGEAAGGESWGSGFEEGGAMPSTAMEDDAAAAQANG